LKKEYVLDNFTRGRIYGYVEANPGEHFNAIKRALDLKNGSLAYHLRTLEREEFITSKRDRGYTRYYPRNMKLPKRNVKELIPIQRNIVVTVKSNPGISQRGIADKLNISFQLVHYHIKVLQEADYLYLEKDEKQTYCYDSETHKLDSEAEKHFMSEPKQEDGTAES
jgi:predicted transcriptional regulator